MADLLVNGLCCFMTGSGMNYDLIIEKSGKFIRIQVKTTKQPALMNREYVTPVYLFNARRAGKGGNRFYDLKEFDAYAFVALDTKQIAYIPFVEKVRKTVILRDRRRKYKVNVGKVASYIDEHPISKLMEYFNETNNQRE